MLLQHTGDDLRGDQTLRNAVVDMLIETRVGWAPDSLQSIGEKFVKYHHCCLVVPWSPPQLASRGIRLPKEVGALQGYNDWRKKKVKKPRIRSSGLDGHIQSPSQTLSLPWLPKSEYAKRRSLIEGITDAMRKYKGYLDPKNEGMKEAHRLAAPRQLVSDVLEVCTLEASDSTVKKCYVPVNETLTCMSQFV